MAYNSYDSIFFFIGAIFFITYIIHVKICSKARRHQAPPARVQPHFCVLRQENEVGRVVGRQYADNGKKMNRFVPQLRGHYALAILLHLCALCTSASAFGTWRLRNAFEHHHIMPAMSEIPFQDQSTDAMNALVFEAAAASTQQSCTLLGIKSIGVDYGLVRTGVALTIGYEPQPITTIVVSDQNNATHVAHQIVTYSTSEQAKRIIVGLPLHKNGTEAPQSHLTRVFASQLACVVMARLGPHVPVYLWDERYTSKEAAARLRSRGGNFNTHDRLHKMLDADAACIILEHYYSENGKGAEQVLVPDDMKEVCLSAWKARKEEEAMQKQAELDQRISRTQRRQEAMERARKLEEEIAKDGVLETNKKKKKKKRNSR